jgi:hypothetical protein
MSAEGSPAAARRVRHGHVLTTPIPPQAQPHAGAMADTGADGRIPHPTIRSDLIAGCAP